MENQRSALSRLPARSARLMTAAAIGVASATAGAVHLALGWSHDGALAAGFLAVGLCQVLVAPLGAWLASRRAVSALVMVHGIAFVGWATSRTIGLGALHDPTRPGFVDGATAALAAAAIALVFLVRRRRARGDDATARRVRVPLQVRLASAGVVGLVVLTLTGVATAGLGHAHGTEHPEPEQPAAGPLESHSAVTRSPGAGGAGAALTPHGDEPDHEHGDEPDHEHGG